MLDTNVPVSAFLNPAGVPARAVELFLEGRLLLAVSQEILEEYRSVLARPRLGLPRKMVSDAIMRLTRAALLVHPAEKVAACRDPDDDKFLACGIASGATFLATGNKRDFPKGAFLGLRIVSPRELVDQLTG